MISDLSARFVCVASDRVDEEIDTALKRLLDYFKVDRCGLLGISSDGKRTHVTHAAYAEGVERVSGDVDLAALFPWSYERLVRRGEVVNVPMTDKVPAEAQTDRLSWAAMGVRSSLTIPLFMRGIVLSLIVINVMREERVWPEEYVPRLRLLGEIFVNALERKRADEALRNSEARLSLAADSAEAGLWVLDYRTLVFWATERALAIFGYAPGELISMERFEASVHPKDLDLIRQVIDRSLRGRETIKVEYRIVLSDGSVKWIASRGQSYFKSTGEPECLMGVSIDITERKTFERQLIESEARLASAIDIAALGFYEMNEDYRISFLDDGMRVLLGIPPEEKERAREFWLTHIYPDDLPRIREVSQKVLNEGVDRLNVEYRYLHPQRGLTWIHHLSRVLERDYAGRAIKVVGVMQDISERRQAEEELLTQKDMLQSIMSVMNSGITIRDLNYNLTYQNEYSIRMSGNHLGEKCYRVFEGIDAVCDDCPVAKAIEDGRSHSLVKEVEMIPGEISFWENTAVPMRDANGNIYACLEINHNITERKLEEEALRQSEAALRSSQNDFRKLAGRLISAKEEELRRLSRELHDDLTQRLAVIAIEAGKLEMDLNKMPAAHPVVLQKIAKVKEQLIKVSEDVHRISRQLHPTILDDLGLVLAIESECTTTMRRENIDITFRHDGVPVAISSDIELCIYRVVQEGLKNVITHANAKSCEIFLKSTDNSLCLTVSDDGRGFDPAEVRHKPGLGLSSMRERAQLVRGDFSITSQPGQGAVIRICVPLNAGDA